MTKGSQLTQLKAALNKAGLTGSPQTNKKRKRALPLEKDKEKKAAKLEEIHQRLNPFDVKVTKLKHEVGGRRLKGTTGKPAQSKQAGIELRKKTLLKEYEEKNRAGGIVDRRFGENDPTMSLEDRMLERFTRERQRASKGFAFNLEDESELTHYGQSLSKLDDFNNVGLDLDSDNEETSGQIGRDVVSKMHFGGFGEEEEGPARKKTKTEVMAEVIAKSKEHKILRQLERDKEDNVRHELDNQFASLRELIYAPDPSSTGSNSIPLGARENAKKAIVKEDSAVQLPLAQNDDYDQHVRELAFDKRAKPKDRTKTEEEVALEAKETLEKAETKRRKRMLGLEESDEEEGTKVGKRKRGADDLEDDFEEEYGTLGAGLERLSGHLVHGQDEQLVASEGDLTEGSDEISEERSEDENESLNADKDLDILEGEEGDHEQLIQVQRTPRGKLKGKQDAELPYTFPCPDSHESFLAIVDELNDKDVPLVVQRIRTLYHSSLAMDNKNKLQTLGTILIDHVLYIASLPKPPFSLITSLFPHIFALTNVYPIPLARHFNDKLNLMHKNLKRGLSRGALDPEAKTWPGLPELSLLRIIGLVWPTSDLNHAVVSPTRLLIGSYLGLGRVRSLRDITSGLFLCTLCLQFESLSKRLIPESINFLINTVLHLAPHSYRDISFLPGSFPSPDFQRIRNLTLKGKGKENLGILSFDDLIISEDSSEQAKTNLLAIAFELLARFAEMYKSLGGFVELYDPVLLILKNVDEGLLYKGLKIQLSDLVDSLQRLLKFSREARRPLRLQAHKPIPIPTYIPKFEVSKSSYLRRQDPDHEKNEAAKLRNQYKQERKGAIRELRKDARFLATVEQKKQIEKDRQYNERLRRVFGSIESERAEEKVMERQKAKDKRRAGKK